MKKEGKEVVETLYSQAHISIVIHIFDRIVLFFCFLIFIEITSFSHGEKGRGSLAMEKN